MMKNRVLRISIIIIMIVGMIMITLVTKVEYNKYLNEYNQNIYNIIGLIKEKYPNITEEEIVILLNGKNDKEQIDKGKEILEKYGIDEEEAIILNLENIYKKNLIINYIIIFTILILIIFCILGYKYYEKRELSKITKYIEEINNKNYKLKIEDNREDDFTNLRNELYKITLMLREQAENSEKEKTNLAISLSDISHQIKTPLTSISIMLDEIKENTNMDSDTKQKFIFEISRQVEQISFLTISLLKLSKLDANAVAFEKKKIEMDNLVDNAIRNLEVPIEIKGQKIIKNIDKCYIVGDYRWLLEAITNIIKNCVEHTENGKNIYIEAKKTNLYVELVIRDEGEGIPEEDLKHIFERFYKGKNSKEDSFGIGLALAKTIIEKQDASIYCSSKENEGTVFRIRWS